MLVRVGRSKGSSERSRWGQRISAAAVVHLASRSREESGAREQRHNRRRIHTPKYTELRKKRKTRRWQDTAGNSVPAHSGLEAGLTLAPVRILPHRSWTQHAQSATFCRVKIKSITLYRRVQLSFERKVTVGSRPRGVIFDALQRARVMFSVRATASYPSPSCARARLSPFAFYISPLTSLP